MYVEPENPPQFAEAVRKLKDSPQLRIQCSESGLSFVREKFARKALAEKYMDILLNKVMVKKKQQAVK